MWYRLRCAAYVFLVSNVAAAATPSFAAYTPATGAAVQVVLEHRETLFDCSRSQYVDPHLLLRTSPAFHVHRGRAFRNPRGYGTARLQPGNKSRTPWPYRRYPRPALGRIGSAAAHFDHCDTRQPRSSRRLRSIRASDGHTDIQRSHPCCHLRRTRIQASADILLLAMRDLSLHPQRLRTLLCAQRHGGASMAWKSQPLLRHLRQACTNQSGPHSPYHSESGPGQPTTHRLGLGRPHRHPGQFRPARHHLLQKRNATGTYPRRWPRPGIPRAYRGHRRFYPCWQSNQRRHPLLGTLVTASFASATHLTSIAPTIYQRRVDGGDDLTQALKARYEGEASSNLTVAGNLPFGTSNDEFDPAHPEASNTAWATTQIFSDDARALGPHPFLRA